LARTTPGETSGITSSTRKQVDFDVSDSLACDSSL
jgi:hypothetical protein